MILEASRKNDGNQIDQPTPTKMDITGVKILMDIKIENNDEGKSLVIKDQCLNKGNQKYIMEEKCLSTKNQFHLKEIEEITNDPRKKSDEEVRDENILVKLSFLHKSKLKGDAPLQVDSRLYNEIIVLKKKWAKSKEIRIKKKLREPNQKIKLEISLRN